MKPIILASQSPRRKELLENAGVVFTVDVPEVEEIIPEGMAADEVSEYLACLKAEAAAKKHPEATVIGSDTTVVLDGTVLGKPADKADACRMLRMLSGRTHVVYTGAAIVEDGWTESFTSATEVTFYELTEEEIEAYAATGEPLDKAGAYGIQGQGFRLVKKINGDYNTVVGLPLAELLRRL